MARYVLHEDPISMNCYKIRLVAAIMGHTLDRKPYNILKGETRTTEFLTKISPAGKIPVLQINDTTFLPESGAACYYLADSPGSNLIPEDRFQRAQMMQWMFFEQNEHEVSIGTMRFWRSFLGFENLDEARKAQIPGKMAAGRSCLERMNGHLGRQGGGWFVGGKATLADVVLYAYTHVANEGGFELEQYPHVKEWIKQVESLDGYIPPF